jgi:dipeptidyl aminopeptidase/acylaminoacyl peptidase
MDKTWLNQVAWVADKYVKGPIRGVVLSFHGLGYTDMKTQPDTVELGWSHAGCLVVFPYLGPWAWMNRLCRQFLDELVEAVYACYGLSDQVPLIAAGGSLGGQGALLYPRYAKRPVAGSVALCPVCDVKYSFSERPDVARTVLYAFRGYAEDRERLFAEHSPLSQIDHMPNIPYLIVHGDQDTAVSKVHHSDPMVAAMRARKMNVEYVEVAGMGHGAPMPVEVMEKQIRFVSSLV